MKRGERGFTLVEVSVASFLLLVVIGATLSALSSGRKASKRTLSSINVEEQAHALLNKIADEVRWASKIGEDTNGNDALDPGEDLNSNGRLEDDWLLLPNSIRFNARRMNGFQLPTTYALQGSTLLRINMTNPAGTMRSVAVAKNVSKFQVSEADGMIKFEVGIRVTAQDGTKAETEDAISIALRN